MAKAKEHKHLFFQELRGYTGQLPHLHKKRAEVTCRRA